MERRQAVSAEDVAYSLNTLNELGAKVKWGKDVQEVLDQATVVDPNTTLIKFKVPAPRFFNHMLSYKYDIGLHIVPKHIFEGQDWTTFAAYDLEKGWPVTTGPWKVVNASPTQKVFDRRDSWWGVEAGVGKLPEVERIVLLPDAGEQQLAQGLISNAVDFSTGLQVATFPTVFAGNPNITTFTGKELPWGNVDWWPTSLYLNCERAPFNDPKFRWAISYLIDRQVLIDVGWGGASSLSPLPMPDGSVYKGLEPYFESAAPLLARYPTNAFDPDKGAELLDELGWKKGGDGLYQDPDGNPFTLEIISFFDFPSVGPVLVELLRRQGVNATYGQPPDMFDRFFSGDFNAAIFGHGGSVSDPYATLRLYQSSASPLPGGQAQHLVNLARWNNKEYDLIADEMYRTPPTETAKMQELWLKAMEIWLPELPDVQLMQFYHRLPMNLTYWKNYPTERKPLRQSGLLPFDLRARAAQPRSGIVDPQGGTSRTRAASESSVSVFYIAKQIGTFLLIVWLAATLNFFLPRLGGENPVAQKLMQTAALGGNLHAGMHEMVEEYQAKFGLDRPLWSQYLTYLADTSRLTSTIRSPASRARSST